MISTIRFKVDKDQNDNHQIGNDNRPVQIVDRVNDQFTHARPCKDRFGHG